LKLYFIVSLLMKFYVDDILSLLYSGFKDNIYNYLNKICKRLTYNCKKQERVYNMRIVLLCAQGMSTSLLVERMKEAAVKKGVNAEIKAEMVDSFDKQLQTADIILLGPQVRYKKNELQPKADKANIPLDVIDMAAYGTIDGDKVLNQAIELSK